MDETSGDIDLSDGSVVVWGRHLGAKNMVSADQSDNLGAS